MVGLSNYMIMWCILSVNVSVRCAFWLLNRQENFDKFARKREVRELLSSERSELMTDDGSWFMVHASGFIYGYGAHLILLSVHSSLHRYPSLLNCREKIHYPCRNDGLKA
jgi:hypothetical protein